MVAFLRQFLVILLVLLQNAAPLVHAHTGGETPQHGLHLHEFEALRLAADNMSLASIDHASDAKSCIVNVGSAIKRQHSNDDATAVLYPMNNDQGFAIARDADIVNFSPQPSGFIPKPLPSHNSSRAPPI